MKSVFDKISKLSLPSILMVVLTILISISPAIAQKRPAPDLDLEIENLRRHKSKIFFDSNQRLHPKRNNQHIIKSQLSSDLVKSLSKSYLNRNKNKIGIKDVTSDFRFEYISKSPAGKHVHYQELIDGIPVYDSRIVVSVNQNKDISFVTRNYHSNIVLKEKRVQIQPQQAIQIARRYLHVSGELRGNQRAEQVVFNSKTNGALLSYRVEIPSSDPFGDWEVFVDAVNGEIIHVKNLIIYKIGTDGKGMVWDPDPLTSEGVFYGGDYADNNDQDHDSLNAQRFLVTLNDLYTDIDGYYVLEGPFVKITNKDAPYDDFPHLEYPDSFIYSREDQDFEAVMVYYHIDRSYRRLLDLGFFANDTVEGLLEFEADPHGNNGLDNSYYSPILNYCAFGEGGVDDAEDAAVIWHEYEHAIQYNISEISYNAEGETRSLLEGCSDYWAASYNRRINSFGWNHVFIWDAGIRSAEGDTTFWTGRRCDLDWHYSKEDSARYSGSHAWGQIWSSALMRIWGDLGADITDKLFISSHYYWGTHPDFNTAAEAFIQADIDIFGGIHLPVILQWFDYHDIIELEKYQPRISHDPNSDIERLSDSYQLSCRIIPSKAGLDTTNLWLIWGLDSSFIDSSQLKMSESEHIYVSEVPGVTQPSSINYYFSARDSLDIFSTDPHNAPQEYYSFYAGPDSLPPPPQNVEITNSISIIDLRWQEIVTGKEVSYKIYRSENGLSFSDIDSSRSSSYTDTTVILGGRYYYYITTVFNQWESNPSDTVNALVEQITSVENDDILPRVYQLRQNYPNPFNPNTIINYDLPITNHVELTIYNPIGQKIAILVSKKQSAGRYQIEWDASGFASGIYYYLIRAGNFRAVRKMILLR